MYEYPARKGTQIYTTCEQIGGRILEVQHSEAQVVEQKVYVQYNKSQKCLYRLELHRYAVIEDMYVDEIIFGSQT